MALLGLKDLLGKASDETLETLETLDGSGWITYTSKRSYMLRVERKKYNIL